MPKFDLSDAADFSRLTQGTIGNVASLLGIGDPRHWDIVEASYNGVKFHVFQLSTAFNSVQKTRWEGALSEVIDYGGRRKVKYQYPYRDGQTTDDLGRRPGSFEMRAVIHGPRYMEGFRALMAEFDKPTPGLLTHPVRGDIMCAVEEVQATHEAQSRKAVALNIVFIEHNFTIGDIRSESQSTFKSVLATALGAFKLIDKAINTINGVQALSTSVKNTMATYLGMFKQNTAKTLTNLNMTFNPKGTLGSVDIPALLPVNIGGTGISTEADGSPTSENPLAGGGAAGANGSPPIVADENFVVVKSINDPFNGVPVSALSPTTIIAIAVPELTKQVQSLRDQAGSLIKSINDSDAALDLVETVLDMRSVIVMVQDALEKGVSSSNARIVDYVLPRVMSLREVAFANGVDVQKVQELDLLNPQLLSVNHIEPGEVVRVPVV